jgi:RNA polymerase sigma factor (sigma-70 family)
MSREREFLAQLPAIDKVIAWVCARRGLRGADAEDFASTVKTRLVENDYEVLARHEGRSSLTTYLAVVVGRLYLDFQVRRFGKWRPSAEARRLGPVALALERLVSRDGLTLAEACGVLGSDPSVRESPAELLALYDRLPRRARRAVTSAAEPAAADADPAERRERQALADRTFAVLRVALAGLPPQDRLLLRLHVESGFTVAQAARTLGIEQKAAYRRKDDLLKRLDWDAALDDRAGSLRWEQTDPRPSNELNGGSTTGEA